MLQALARHAQGDMPAALASLEHALTLAEPEGYVRLFVDEGEPMRLLIADCRLLIEKHKHGEGRNADRVCRQTAGGFPAGGAAAIRHPQPHSATLRGR